MEWPRESIIDFINSYRCKEILWDTKHPKYYNKIKKNDAWEELAVEFNTTADECKKKMNGLLSALRREKAKVKKRLSDVYESSWFAFKSMQFLWDKNKVRKTQSTISDEPEEVEEREILSVEPTLTNNNNEDVVEETQQTVNNVPERRLKRMRPAKRQNISEDSKKLDEAFQILTKASATASSSQEQNEFQIFGNLVAKKLAKYSPELQSTVQQDIMNVLFKGDRIHLNQNSTNFRHFQSYHTDALQLYFTNSMPQNSQIQRYQESVESDSTPMQSQVSSPAYTYACSSTSNHSNSSLPTSVNISLAHQIVDMPDAELTNL
ncbi:hypothetical protein ABEB36_015106 [Hypothenemus hampei]|uniref:MADF domain-containing protein n=1 Tax=Hypothenemus hampei TaxID=57062 RepID=A0ABD1E0F3_HYPHA